MNRISTSILFLYSVFFILSAKAQENWTPKSNPKIEPNFLYALPYANETKTKVITENPPSKTINFYTEEPDTIVAIRKGKIIKIIESFANNPKSKNKINELLIEHMDGTFATYQGFRNGIFVKEGKTVYPGTPLAINSVSNEGFSFRLMINYLKSDEVVNKRGERIPGAIYGFIEPHFSTKENANGILTSQKYYTSAITPEIIQKEMTKKEIKNLTKK